ncbi:MAG: choice-of-anchor D domain-containing protein [Candidatus Eisenbacteria bacterium]|uniref:Choice-of-anchor D domain-containing protein n=1 Tax=Eiseniibacteriota bacterium TaxID=2212470 RepID=A0A849SI74_UNCEI|nr:choice-of-anchor D domain-containing protein [Candidatus Eisenbacteria bacterium]
MTLLALTTLRLQASADTALYRVNCGGPAVAALDGGPGWTSDTAGAGASPYTNATATGDNVFGSSATIQPPHASVPAYVPLAVFADERWDPGTAPEMQWEFPVPNGTYRVNLMFTEAYEGTQFVGARRIDVACEGVVRLDDFDSYAAFGGYTPGMESFIATVSDGGLSLELRHTAFDDPAIRGIEVVTLSASGVLAPSSGSVGFGTIVVGQTSVPHQVVLTNLGAPGDPTLTISGITNSGPFAHTLTSQSLAPGQSRAFNVTFSPLAAGAATGSIEIAHDGNDSPLTIALNGQGTSTPVISFGKTVLTGTVLTNPTSLQFGPDGRLYVAQQNGLIRIYGVARSGPNQYAVTSTETIFSVQALQNHDDDGSVNSGLETRLVTGLLVTGTATNPVIYVTSSDPRIHVAGDINLDTNSGILTRLSWNGASWDHLDLVRGFPRSENDHATNGMALDVANQRLYLAQGGNTNMGAPSNNFSFLPEYALAGAILSVDLAAIGNTTYDLPTLNDEDRAGVNDANDPFGGNDGKNQARLVPGGPVQVHSPGWRNPFDLVVHSSGRLYAIDNGPNAGWGGPPIGEGPGSGCTNADNDNNSATLVDNLHLIPAAGFYAGHPNPTRASTANTFNATIPQSPVASGNPVECEYLEPGVPVASGGDGALATWNFSTDGIVEYRASNFAGQMQGDLLAGSFNNSVERVALSVNGDSTRLVQTLFSNVGNTPLDVTAQADADTFPGTIWVAEFIDNQIIVFEPTDYEGGGFVCDGTDNPALDEDGDGYDNADEIDGSSNPCSAADLPADFDHDFTSDLNDPDDDDDGILDIADAFARDATNGAATLPIEYSWDAGSPGFGFFGLGFTGLMVDGTTDYLAMYDPVLITAGGAAGKFTVDAVTAGDALGALDNQRYAFQFGIATTSATGPFRVRSRVSSPYFGGLAPSGSQSLGIVIGDGGDDDYLKLVLTGDAGSPALEVVHEVAGVVISTLYPAPGFLAGTGVDLLLDVDPSSATVQPRAGMFGQPDAALGAPIVLAPGSALHAAVTGAPPLAVGVIATSRGAAPFSATWDFYDVLPIALVGVERPSQPLALRLLPSFPNPAVGGTTLRFELPRSAHVRLAVFDVSGARMRTIEDGERSAGAHALRWDGRDERGRSLPAGIYFGRLEVDREVRTQRIAVIR